jgi:serine/threonine protein kinase
MTEPAKFKVELTIETRPDEDDPIHLLPGSTLTQPRFGIISDDDGTIATSDEVVYTIIGERTRKESYARSYVASRKNLKESEPKEDRVFISMPRLSRSTTRAPELDVKLASVYEVFQRVYQNREAFQEMNESSKITADLYGIGFQIFRIDSRDHYVPFLIQEFVDECPVDLFLERYDGKRFSRENSFKGITDPKVWFKVAASIVGAVRRIHHWQIIHGEINPKNILLREAGTEFEAILVDFSRTSHLDLRTSTGPRGRQANSYLAPEVRSEEESEPSTFVADIYALGGVLFFLATGESPPDINDRHPSDNKIGIHRNPYKWKERIQADFAKNKKLMEKNEAIVKIIDKCMRPNPSDRFPSTERVLHALNSVNYEQRVLASTPAQVPHQIHTLTKSWDEVKNALTTGSAGIGKLRQQWDDLFTIIVNDKLDILKKEIEDMKNGYYEIYGEREDIIDTLIKYISVLRPGDIYVTATQPHYWEEFNLGVNGRFLAVNKDLVRNGVQINRLFLTVKDDFEPGSTSHRILAAHYKAWKSLEEVHRVTTPRWEPRWGSSVSDVEKAESGGLYLGFLDSKSMNERKSIQRDIRYVAIWRRHEPRRTMGIVFVSKPIYEKSSGKELHDVGEQIVKVRFRTLNDEVDYQAYKKMFEDGQVHSVDELARELGIKDECDQQMM